MIGYKFTHPDLTTFGSCKWTVGEWRATSGSGPLYAEGWFHAYEHELLAELHATIHGNYPPDAPLWRVEYGGHVLRNGQMQFGADRMRLTERVERPTITPTQRVTYAILCAKAVCADYKAFVAWADGWLAGTDRSKTSDYATYLTYSTYALYGASSVRDTFAAHAASHAGYAALFATDNAGYAALFATDNASAAIYCARAAEDATAACPDLDLLLLAKQATEVTP